MFIVKTSASCHCCPATIDCKDTPLRLFVTKQGRIRHLCKDCDEINILMESEDYLFWGFLSAEDYIRHVRKEQERLEK